jgi:hypothetical protein
MVGSARSTSSSSELGGSSCGAGIFAYTGEELATDAKVTLPEARCRTVLKSNAKAEAFFGTLKTECFPANQLFATKGEARREIFEYIEVYYTIGVCTARWVTTGPANMKQSLVE